MIESGLQLRSTVKADGTLELSLVETPVPAPQPHEVVIRVEATPLNPSDQGLLFAGADMSTAKLSGTAKSPVVTARIAPEVMRAHAARVDRPMPVGNEGAGVVVEAGESAQARALLGRTVAVVGGGMYAQFRCVPAALCLELPEGTSAVEGASCFVNPLTALGMTEALHREGHRGLVHTAAASNLGQMLVKVCRADGIPLVNIVRKPEQQAVLQSLGAEHVVSSSAPSFMRDLIDAIAATGATLAFDAIGGGPLISQILTAMEIVAARSLTEFSRYGSTTHKQVYIYGGLDRSPTILNRSFGMHWGVGGWLLTPFLQRIGQEGADRLRRRVAAELKTTFASHYSKEVSLAQALSLEAIGAYARQATGEKYLIRPQR